MLLVPQPKSYSLPEIYADYIEKAWFRLLIFSPAGLHTFYWIDINNVHIW